MLSPDIQPSDTDQLATMGDVIIIGGGCYGTFYAQQLERARDRGKARYRRLLVVDRNAACQIKHALAADPEREIVVAEWGEFLDRYLEERAGDDSPHGGPEDVIVPSPLMPHLMYQWLIRRARSRWPERPVETRPIHASPRTPYDATAPDHTRYISFADWICPTHCVEPALCPVIRGPRTWEMSEAVELLTQRLDQHAPTGGPVLFQCRHTVFAVGTFSVVAVIDGDRRIAELGASGTPLDIVIGTISSCHGAVNLLHLGASGNR